MAVAAMECPFGVVGLQSGLGPGGRILGAGWATVSNLETAVVDRGKPGLAHRIGGTGGLQAGLGMGGVDGGAGAGEV